MANLPKRVLVSPEGYWGFDLPNGRWYSATATTDKPWWHAQRELKESLLRDILAGLAGDAEARRLEDVTALAAIRG